MNEEQLTPRQREVLVEVCKGRSNKEIARNLGMAEATVKLHLTEIFKTIGVKTRAQAIAKASNFQVTDKEPPPPLTDMEVMGEFTELVFTTSANKWADRVLEFGHAVEKLTRFKFSKA